MYSWGSGYGGKLGQGHLRDRATPLRVATLKDMKVTKIACHEFHSAAVCGNIITKIYFYYSHDPDGLMCEYKKRNHIQFDWSSITC